MARVYTRVWIDGTDLDRSPEFSTMVGTNPSVGERQVLEALKGVVDPDRRQDIVALGMVSGFLVKDGNVGFAIEVDPARGPALEPLRPAAEKAVEDRKSVV